MVAPTRQRSTPPVLEQGSITLAYRPRSEADHVGGIEDLERIYVVLSPENDEPRPSHRVIVIGRKISPSPRSAGPPYWGMVTRVADSAEKISLELGREEYMTRARGRRVRPAARHCGDGAYCIARHGDHTQLAYALDARDKPGPVRRALDIPPEGSFILSIKNPVRSASHDTHSLDGPVATYPERLQDRFEDRRFIPVETAEFLDFEGTQIVLLSPDDTRAAAELGIRLDPAAESAAAARIGSVLRIHQRQGRPPLPLQRART